ncbi:MAG TPA: VOC family protein, partial [Microthrixaceae bacterium]|nr:VOC family protein [Microthrixaceae bacterium]
PGPEYGGYVNFLVDGIMVAGCMSNTGQPEMEGMPDVWSIYLASDDAEKTVESAIQHGGLVFVAAMDIMDLGRMAVVGDAGGASVGVWQPRLHQGFGLLGEPGAPSWFELHARDYDATVTFYRDVFRWDTHVESDSAEFRCTTLGRHGAGFGALAGIIDASGFLADGESPHWTVHFGVEDTDSAVTQVRELGGAVMVAADDGPYGRLATVADPTGAVFRIVQLGHH